MKVNVKTPCAEAAQLWIERDRKSKVLSFSTLSELSKLDLQLEHSLTLLCAMSDSDWKTCWDHVVEGRSGYVFVAAATALKMVHSAGFKQLIDHVKTVPGVARELVAALSWVTGDYLWKQVHDLLNSASPLMRYIGIKTHYFHQNDPGIYLEAAFHDPDYQLCARALRIVGELKLRKYLNVLTQYFDHPDIEIKFWASWSAKLLMDSDGCHILWKILQSDINPSLKDRGFNVLIRSIPPEQANALIDQIISNKDFTLALINGLGGLGNPCFIPWLLDCMASDSPKQIGLAGQSFSLITGVDLMAEGLIMDSPAAALEDLPLPNHKEVARWWNKNRYRYKKGRRYLMGFPITKGICWQTLIHGRQFQRLSASVELALLEDKTAIYPIEAPGFRQCKHFPEADIFDFSHAINGSLSKRSTIPQLFSPRLRYISFEEPDKKADPAQQIIKSKKALDDQQLILISRSDQMQKTAFSNALSSVSDAYNQNNISPPIKNIIKNKKLKNIDRHPIKLSSTVFNWYFERLTDFWQACHAISSSHYSTLSQLFDADCYLRSYLEYLPDTSQTEWKKIEGLSEEKWSAGYLFSSSFIAIKNEKLNWFRRVSNIAVAYPKISQGFISSFGWLPATIARKYLNILVKSKYGKWKKLAIAVATTNSIPCDESLVDFSKDGDRDLQILSIKSIGKMGRKNLLPILLKNFRSTDIDLQFWSAWSAVLLGDREEALDTLKRFALNSAPLLQQQALHLILRCSAYEDVKRWLSILEKYDRYMYSVITGIGDWGYVSKIPWLIQLMNQPQLAWIAGRAFMTITGVDVFNEGLIRPRIIHPSDKDQIDSIETAQLFLPDPKAIESWWAINRIHYQDDKRYLMGRAITFDHCIEVLSHGRQYQRDAAALEIGLLQHDLPVLEIHATSFQQCEWIEIMCNKIVSK